MFGAGVGCAFAEDYEGSLGVTEEGSGMVNEGGVGVGFGWGRDQGGGGDVVR